MRVRLRFVAKLNDRPTLRELRLRLALLYFQRKEWKTARTLLEPLLQADPATQGDAAAARDQMLAAVEQAEEAGDAETKRLLLESLRAVHSELGENEAAAAAVGKLKVMGVPTSPPPKKWRDC